MCDKGSQWRSTCGSLPLLFTFVSWATCVTSVFTGMTLGVLPICDPSLSPGVLPARYVKWVFCDILDVLCLCNSFLTPSVWPARCVTSVFNGSTQGALYLCYPALGKMNKALHQCVAPQVFVRFLRQKLDQVLGNPALGKLIKALP